MTQIQALPPFLALCALPIDKQAGTLPLQPSCCETEGRTLNELGCVVTHCFSSLFAGF